MHVRCCAARKGSICVSRYVVRAWSSLRSDQEGDPVLALTRDSRYRGCARLMVALLLILCSSVVLAKSITTLTDQSQQRTVAWWHYPNLDVPSLLGVNAVLRDLGEGTPLHQLKSACAADARCLAFSTAGRLHNFTNSTHGAVGTELFVKHTVPQPPTGLPWPLPREFSRGNTSLCLGNKFHIKNVGPAAQSTLGHVIDRYEAQIPGQRSGECPSTGNEITELQVSVMDTVEDLQLGVNESYSLHIPQNGIAELVAATQYGALHGLETFTQLVSLDVHSDGSTSVLQHAPWRIDDGPRFPWRGVMLDTSRHYFPVEAIENLITAMTYSKLNVFHWHITDWNSWPMQSHHFPELWFGAFSAYERYTTADMGRVVGYAKERGVRVVVEIDVPAHAGSVCAGLPELCSWSGCPTDLQLLNPASSKTWEVLAALANETTSVFTDKVMHWGGDEVINGWAGAAHGCWTNDPKVRSWMSENKVKDDLGIYLYFVNYVDQLARNRTVGGTPMHWHDYWAAAKSAGVSVPNHIVQNWGGAEITTGASADGHRVVVSGGWYLDNAQPWEAMYTIDPQAGITDSAQRELVLGGEAALWSESQDLSNLDSRAWPRGAAIAERLWSPIKVGQLTRNPEHNDISVDVARPRLLEFRCLLLRRGVAAGTVSGSSVKDAGPCGMQLN